MTKSIFIGSAAIFAIISLFQLSAHAGVAASHACPTSSLPSDGGKMPVPSPDGYRLAARPRLHHGPRRPVTANHKRCEHH
jgi:hypothetical protein